MKRITLSLALGVLAAAVGAAAGWEELPLSLRRALAEPDHPFMTYVHWSEARGHPVVARILELRRVDAMPSIDLANVAYGPLLALIDHQVIDEEDLAEVWISTRSPDSSRFERAWLRSELETPALEQSLEESGWEAGEGTDAGLWVRVPADQLPSDFDQMPPEEQEKARRYLMSREPQLELLEGGWLLVRSPAGEPAAAAAVEREGEETPSLEDLEFPLDRLAEPGRGVLLLLAADLPQESERAGDEVPGETAQSTDEGARRPEELDTAAAVVEEMQRVEERLRVLGQQPEARAEGMFADFVAAVTETDGGLALWIEARCTDPDQADMTGALYSAFLSAIRVMVFHASRSLWWELGGARIDVQGDSVLLEARASSASLLEALDTEVERRAEMEELYQRLRELYDRLDQLRQEQLEREAAQAP